MIVLNEQAYRNFRSFYRSVKNGNGRDVSLLASAFYWLAATNQNHQFKDEDWEIGGRYLTTGPRCDGDTLTIAGEG